MQKALTVFTFFIFLFNLPLEGGIFGSDGNQADYIVVGVGTAGGAVAKMLTDDMQTSVIALHNGPNLSEDPLIKLSENAVITVPAGFIGPPLYINGSTVPQPFADHRELLWAVAVPEGGASSINAGVYVRGTDQVYSQWKALGGPHWSLKQILETFIHLENYHGQTDDPSARGHNGPISILQVQKPSKISQVFTQATQEATGLPYVLDYNDPKTPIGVSAKIQFAQSGPNGIYRVSSATAFLNSSVVAPNGLGVHGRKLLIHYDCIASKVIWSGKTATGVEYLQNGQVKKVYANKGVIVCAGLMSSPFLLRSGVGPKALLQSLKIPVVFDNPNVGQGLVDQPGVRLLFSTDPFDSLDEKTGVKGLFHQISHLPDPQGPPTVRALRLAILNSPTPGIVIGTFDLLQPKSRGSITIKSANPMASPVVNIGVLSDSSDLDLYMRGFQVYLSALNKALQKINPDYELISPDPDILSDPALVEKFIREEVSSNEHFQSHCRMAPLSKGGVVDGEGRVYGVHNLYVADNSIVPLCMDGAPMASAYLMGARVAQQIIAHNPPSPFSPH